MPNASTAGWEQWDSLFPTTPDPEIARLSGKTINATQKHRKVLRDSGKLVSIMKAEAVLPQEVTHSDTVVGEPITPSDYVGFNIAFWDLETTNLKAFMGRVLCGSVADVFGNVKTFRVDETTRENLIDDRELVVSIRDYIEQFDVWVTWNGKLFDKPFLNARLMEHGERPLRTDIMHIDAMYYAKGQFMKIGSARLVNVQRFLDAANSKTEISWKEWQLAAAGDADAMNIVVEHCEADCLVLREVFGDLKPHIKNIHR